jgi:hypothetical protein
MQYNIDTSGYSFKCKKCRFNLFPNESLVRHKRENDGRECDFGIFVSDQTVDWLTEVVKEVEGKVSFNIFIHNTGNY